MSAEECWPAGCACLYKTTECPTISSQQLHLVPCRSVIQFAVTDRFYKCGNVTGSACANC